MKDEDKEFQENNQNTSDEKTNADNIEMKEGDAIEHSLVKTKLQERKNENDIPTHSHTPNNKDEKKAEPTPLSRVRRKSERKKNRKSRNSTNKMNFIINSFVALIVIFLLIIPFAYTKTTIENNIKENTISIQKGISASLHHLDLYQHTNNTGHLISLQNELVDLKNLMEQTEKMNESLLYTENDEQPNFLLNYTKQNIMRLEQILLGNIQLDEHRMYNFEMRFKIIELHTEKHPTIHYETLVESINKFFSKK